MRRSAGLVLVAILLAGCGKQSTPENALDAKLQKIDYTMATYETVNSSYSHSYFEKATRHYIAVIREYADRVEPAEIKRRLVDRGDEIGSYCLPCAGMLYDEAKKY